MNAWLPLEVLPGWETPDALTGMEYLLLCVLGPLAVGLVIAVIGWTPKLMKRGRDEAAEEGLVDEIPADEQPKTEVMAGTARRALD